MNYKYWLQSATGSPLRYLIRKKYSIHANLGGIPMYLVRCERDLRLALEIIQDSWSLFSGRAGIWVCRLPQLIDSIVLIETVRYAKYFSFDRCICINIWGMHNELAETGMVADLKFQVAATLVETACTAFIDQKVHSKLTADQIVHLRNRAAMRFLNRFSATEGASIIPHSLHAYSVYTRKKPVSFDSSQRK